MLKDKNNDFSNSIHFKERYIMRNISVILIVLFLLSCAITRTEVAPAQLSPDKISIEYDRVEFKNPSISGIDYEFRFVVENKNDVPVKLREVEYSLLLADIKVPSQKKELNLIVEPHKNGSFEIVIPVRFPEESEKLEEFLARKSAGYDLSGVVRGDGFEIPIGAKYEIVLPEIPQVSVPGASIASGEKGEIGFTFDLLISNNNTFDVKIDFFDYKVIIEDIPVGEGRVAEMEKCPPNAQLSYTFNAKIDLSKYAIQVKKMLSQKRFNYTIEGVLGIEGKKFSISRKGTINFSMR